MDDKEDKFLPFNAINEFMLPAYRLEVLQTVLGADALLVSRGREINGMIKRYATIQGFRNCLVAPMPLKIKACVQVFEQHADFDALILQSWSDLKLDLRQSMYGHLNSAVGKYCHLTPTVPNCRVSCSLGPRKMNSRR